ncbi:MAG TPA: ornithine carbamoyltransferase, partial [Alphaproteobacteria bacterium]|nr:ornithine carbamoyltransferase [Alphaproteobacteria bacterium]
QARSGGADIVVISSAQEAAKGADCIVTDTWVQMSEADQLGEGGTRRRHLELMPFQVNDQLMSLAHPHAVFMHCLPA